MAGTATAQDGQTETEAAGNRIYEGSTEIIIEDPQNTSDDQVGRSGSGSQPPPSGKPVAKGQGSLDLSKIDRAELLKILDQDEEFKKEVTRTIRTKDVETKAEARARQIAQEQLDILTRQSTEAQTRYETLVRTIRDAQLAQMPEPQRKLAEAEDRITVIQREADQRKILLDRVEDEAEKEKFLARAKIDWGLTDEDVEEFRSLDTAPKVVDAAFKRLAKVISDLRKELAIFKAKSDATERVQTGESTYAATAKSSAGGNLSDDELEVRFLEDPVKYGEQYRERRIALGRY